MFKFLVYRSMERTIQLCEGGVFTDDSAILDSAQDYGTNDLAAALGQCEQCNRDYPGTYELVDSMEGVQIDSTVASSLSPWQIDAIKAGDWLTPLGLIAWLERQAPRSPLDTHKRDVGLAVINNRLGGAKRHDSLSRLIIAIENESSMATVRTDGIAEAIGYLDSNLEHGAEMANRYRSESLVCNGLRADNAALAADLEGLRKSESEANAALDIVRNANIANAEARAIAERELVDLRAHAIEVETTRDNLESELRETRESLGDWHGKALVYHTQRDEHAARADKAERQLARLMNELAGLTLGQLPAGAYGGSLADVFCDIKAGR